MPYISLGNGQAQDPATGALVAVNDYFVPGTVVPDSAVTSVLVSAASVSDARGTRTSSTDVTALVSSILGTGADVAKTVLASRAPAPRPALGMTLPSSSSSWLPWALGGAVVLGGLYFVFGRKK